MKTAETKGAAHSVARVALSAAVICVSAMISLPFFVPLTLQTLAFYFVIYTFGARTGLAATAVYTALGLVGLPVFAGFSGGVGRLFEPSGGFIIGFVLAAAVYLVVEALLQVRCIRLPTVLSFIVLYASGSLMLILLYTDGTAASALAAIALYILPYVFPDVIKIALAAFLSSKLKKHIRI